MDWKRSFTFITASQCVNLRIDHADYGRINSFGGSNMLPQNRLYFCAETCGAISWPDDNGKFKTQPLTGGNVFFMPGNIELRYEFTGGEMAAIHFNLEIITGYDIFTGRSQCRFSNYDPKLTRTLIKKLDNIHDIGDSFAIQAEIMQAAGKFCDFDSNALGKQQLLREKYRPLLQFLDNQLTAKTTVAQAAGHLNISRDNLSKNFRRDFDMPLKKYLTQRLLNKASQLLTKPAMRVNEAAFELGFNSEFYFSRFFKKHTGMPPSEYRQRYGKCGPDSKTAL